MTVKFCLSAVAFRAHGTIKLLWTTLTGTRLLERFVDLLLQLHAVVPLVFLDLCIVLSLKVILARLFQNSVEE